MTGFKRSYGLCLSIFIVPFSLMYGCRDPFVPVITPSNLNILVVEGIINSGIGPTHISLSRTANIADSLNSKPELNSTIKVEGEDHSVFSLSDSGSGNYSALINLNKGVRYRIHIICASGEEYISDYSRTIHTTSLDSVNWTRDNKGVHIFVNSNDSVNNSHYYRFYPEETWEIHSSANSYFVYSKHEVKPRDILEVPQLFLCWKYNIPSTILQASSALLGKSILSNFPILTIPEGDEKLSVRYSVLIKFYAQSLDSYDFYDRLKKNSELTGSIFSSQPSQLKSNIHTIKGNKIAIGFINVGEEKSARLFISNSQVNGWSYHRECPIKKIPVDSINFFYPTYTPLIDSNRNAIIIAYFSTFTSCADCRLRGTPIKPTFW